MAGVAPLVAMALSTHGEVSFGTPNNVSGLPSAQAAPLNGVASALSLAVTRFLSRIEWHLVDRTDGLERSLRQANSDLQRICLPRRADRSAQPLPTAGTEAGAAIAMRRGCRCQEVVAKKPVRSGTCCNQTSRDSRSSASKTCRREASTGTMTACA